MNNLEAHNVTESSQGDEPSPNVQPLANLNGNPLHQSSIVGEHEHSPYQPSVTLLYLQKLQDMITNTNRVHCRGSSQISLIYSMPYSKCNDNSRLPVGYEPSKQQQFDAKGENSM